MVRAPKGYKPESVSDELFAKFMALHGKELDDTILPPDDISEEEWEEAEQDDTESTNLKATVRARSLAEAGEYEELRKLCKVQIIMDPKNAKSWRRILKHTAKQRRQQRPKLLRAFLLLVKIVGALIALVIIAAFIGALIHH